MSLLPKRSTCKDMTSDDRRTLCSRDLPADWIATKQELEYHTTYGRIHVLDSLLEVHFLDSLLVACLTLLIVGLHGLREILYAAEELIRESRSP